MDYDRQEYPEETINDAEEYRPPRRKKKKPTLKKYIRALGRYLASLPPKALVFTGGIGEHAAPVREKIVARADWLGLELDPAANASHRTRITTADSDVPAYVIPTNEELMIARQTRALLGA